MVRALDLTDAKDVVRTAGLIVGVHVLLTVALALALATSDVGVGLVRTTVGAVLLAGLAVGWGAGRESGLLDQALNRFPGVTRALLRGVLAGLLTALALCTAVVAVAVAADARGYAALSGSLGGAGAGVVGLLGLALLLLPNAAAAVLGLAAGPGFFVGTGTLVSVHGVTLSPVPALPLLAALPDTQAVPLLAFVSQVIPALAGLVAGATVGRWFSDEDGGSGGRAHRHRLGVLLGVVSGVLVWIGGGVLGDGNLAVVGAPPIRPHSRWPPRAASPPPSRRPSPVGARWARRPRPEARAEPARRRGAAFRAPPRACERCGGTGSFRGSL